MPILTELADVLAVLTSSRTVAVLGAHIDPDRPAHYVPEYLHEQGYKILPVNPSYIGHTLWGEPVVAVVNQLRQTVDLIDVFRRGDDIAMHVPEILAMDPLPRAVWFQLGIRNDAAARALSDAGIAVVQDRCTLADHEAHQLPPARQP